MSDVGGCVKLKSKDGKSKLIVDIEGTVALKANQWDEVIAALKELETKFKGISVRVVGKQGAP